LGGGNLGREAGAYSPIFFALREMEPLVDLLEQLSGHRWHHGWIVPGGVRGDAPEAFLSGLRAYLPYLEERLNAYEDFFSDNAIWINRSELIGTLELEHALAHGASGPVLRASGAAHDLRRDSPYLFYSELEFDIPTGESGDTLDRYRVRLMEMRQSIRIIQQCLERLPAGRVRAEHAGDASAAADRGPRTADGAGWLVPKGEAYLAVESPRGELGLLVVSDGGPSPARLHLRPPSLYHLFLLDELCRGYLLADLFVIYGSLDIMVGEVDR
jgi:NADH:ubiquinone oxidoreductase subunit D